MFGAHACHIPYGSQVDTLIPIEQFALVEAKRGNLGCVQINVKEILRVVDEFFHSVDYILLVLRKEFICYVPRL